MHVKSSQPTPPTPTPVQELRNEVQNSNAHQLQAQGTRSTALLFATRCWISVHSQSVQSVCSSPETCSTSGLGQISREHVVVAVVPLANQKAVGGTEALTLKKHKVVTLAKGKQLRLTSLPCLSQLFLICSKVFFKTHNLRMKNAPLLS